MQIQRQQNARDQPPTASSGDGATYRSNVMRNQSLEDDALTI